MGQEAPVPPVIGGSFLVADFSTGVGWWEAGLLLGGETLGVAQTDVITTAVSNLDWALTARTRGHLPFLVGVPPSPAI